MKKIAISFYCILLAGILYAQDKPDLYDISFYTIDSFKLDMSIYKGKTVIIATIDASKPERSALQYLDSINRNSNSEVNVVGILINDFGKSKKKEALLNHIRAGRGLSFPISDVVRAGKNEQDENDHFGLIEWLRKGAGNKHFKIDLDEPEKLFVISKTGVLYGVLSGRSLLSHSRMTELLNTQPNN